MKQNNGGAPHRFLDHQSDCCNKRNLKIYF
jgi:hypothetical protein